MNNSGIWVIPNAPTAHNSKLNIPNSKFKKLLAILTDRQQPEKYFDYDYKIPPKESNLRKRLCRARDGVC